MALFGFGKSQPGAKCRDSSSMPGLLRALHSVTIVVYWQREALTLPRTRDGIDAVAFSPDAKFIATGGMQQSVQVWNLATRQARNLAGHTAEITSVAFSPNEPLLASGGRAKTVRLWNINTGA